MKIILFTLLIFFTTWQKAGAQDKNPDAKAMEIPGTNCSSIEALSTYIRQNFETDSAKVRAIFIWIANHISYDVPRLLSRDKHNNVLVETVAEVLSSRSGVCQGYSDLFVALCEGVGINAIRISGYTKRQGKVSQISHVWVAANLNGTWFLFDPTWGAGYVNNDVYFKRYNEGFYKVPAEKLIQDHMPFDPMYQFLSYPLTNKQFIEGSPSVVKTVFNYNDSIKYYALLSPPQQKEAELRRLESGGIENDLLQERRDYLKNSLQSFASKDAFEEGGKAYNNARVIFTAYRANKKNQFSSISDNDLKQMFDSLEYYVKQSRNLISLAIPKTDAQREAKAGNITNIDQIWAQVNKAKQFAMQYLAADKDARKRMFTGR